MAIEFHREGKVLVVAEIGNNHEGDFALAQLLVRKAAECGADAVKFQTFIPEYFVSRNDEARFRRFKSFQLSFREFEELSRLARSLGLWFISTPLDMESASFLEKIVDAYKIASGDNNFYPMLRRVAETAKPVVVSTGASDLTQVSRTVAFLKEHWAASHVPGQLALLHCVSSYPVPPEEASLRSIPYLMDHFDCAVGYSDHTIGIEATVLAVALGATVIEKHFTLKKDFSDFRDHQLSADPGDFRELTRRIRAASAMLGRYAKTVQPCEEKARGSIRRSVVAARNLPPGCRVSPSDITWLRSAGGPASPAGGLEPGLEEFLIGKVLKRPVMSGERLELSDVE